MKQINHLMMAAGIVSICFAGSANAEETKSLEIKPYIGVGIGGYVGKYEETASTYRFDFQNPTVGGYVKGGAEFHKNFAAELRVGATGEMSTGWAAGTLAAAATTTTLKADYMTTLLLVGKVELPVLESTHGKIEAYGVLGGTLAKIVGSYSLSANQKSASKIGFTYGAGLSYTMDDKISLGVEWVEYLTNVDTGWGTGGTTSTVTIRGVSGTASIKF